MVLPLYLAMTAAEMACTDTPPRYFGVFDAAHLPPGAMGILTDRIPFQDPLKTAEAVRELNCGSVLLDFARKPDAGSRMVADALFQALPCPVAAPPAFAGDSDCAVFLPPCPLHVPLAEYLRPWQNRDIWLDITLQQQTVTVTPRGTVYSPAVPADRQDGVFDEILMCRCITEVAEDMVRFILFDTPETLKIKLEEAAKRGVTRAVGLYQELGKKSSPQRGGFCQM